MAESQKVGRGWYSTKTGSRWKRRNNATSTRKIGNIGQVFRRMNQCRDMAVRVKWDPAEVESPARIECDGGEDRDPPRTEICEGGQAGIMEILGRKVQIYEMNSDKCISSLDTVFRVYLLPRNRSTLYKYLVWVETREALRQLYKRKATDDDEPPETLSSKNWAGETLAPIYPAKANRKRNRLWAKRTR
ncbi:uncharacterized protein CIMG_04044 [Coccidioides immitis RS]|uniref:Uncharacterized protein n=1 Tax=Coccidioides immitis (strain RS) TaxID=246410 RepID=J3KCN6_COCIM|nr:uncharacterized protein CIMG_04044 [Coccidioides immitis RS]EAS33020.3 hypothetical protein CIMG_04044 [Coccidioides immitis RS]